MPSIIITGNAKRLMGRERINIIRFDVPIGSSRKSRGYGADGRKTGAIRQRRLTKSHGILNLDQ
jgi:hypothetical protein